MPRSTTYLSPIMLFDNKLQSEIYAPWEGQYINYANLKKLLKEGLILKNAWTETDEQNFVSALDSDLEKVYTFQRDKYHELNEILNDLQESTTDPSVEFDFLGFTSKLELVLSSAQELNHFQRLNYTGFAKIVKKHDRLHPAYSVKPLLNVRLKSLPFHSEDYLPLLFKISALFQFLRENYNLDLSVSKLSPFNDDSMIEQYKSFKFWIHPDNLMEVKATILRRLPMLVYNQKNGFDDDDDDDDEDDPFKLSKNDPTINCLYFDSESFDLYNNKLMKLPNASTLRLKWIGPLYKKPEIVLEKKVFEKQSETYDENEKLVLKEKYLDSFVGGNFDSGKYLKKMAKKGRSEQEIEDTRKRISSLSDYIEENNFQPCLRTTYKRTAFQIPGDDNVRVVIDSDIYFIREDAFDQQRPIRDPHKWHRTDIDSRVSNPFSLLRKGEYVKFMYAEMEIKVKTKRTSNKLAWVDDLAQSHLVKEIPNFSKFVHGISSLFLEDDKLENIPFWYNELESDLKMDPQQALIDNKEKLAKFKAEEENLLKFKSKLASSFSSLSCYAPRKKSFSVSGMGLSELAKSSVGLESSTETHPGELKATSGSDLNMSSAEYEDKDVNIRPITSLKKIQATISKLLDVDSEEEEEVELPIGVSEPESYIKNAGPLRVEPKVWLANERTFYRWLHVTTLLSTLTFIIYSSTSRANFTQLATWLAYLYFALTLFSGVWGYYIFMRRREIIIERSDSHLDNVFGPLFVAFGLMAGFIINFVYGFQSAAQLVRSTNAADIGVYAVTGVTFEYLERNPWQKRVLEFVFWIVGA